MRILIAFLIDPRTTFSLYKKKGTAFPSDSHNREEHYTKEENHESAPGGACSISLRQGIHNNKRSTL